MEVMPETICVTSWRTGIISPASVLSARTVLPEAEVPELPELSLNREVRSMPLLRICKGYSLRVERSMLSM